MPSSRAYLYRTPSYLPRHSARWPFWKAVHASVDQEHHVRSANAPPDTRKELVKKAALLTIYMKSFAPVRGRETNDEGKRYEQRERGPACSHDLVLTRRSTRTPKRIHRTLNLPLARGSCSTYQPTWRQNGRIEQSLVRYAAKPKRQPTCTSERPPHTPVHPNPAFSPCPRTRLSCPIDK